MAAFTVEIGDFSGAGAAFEGDVKGFFLHCEDIGGWDVFMMLCLGSLQRRVRRGWRTRIEWCLSDHARTFQNTRSSHLFMNAEIIDCERLVLTATVRSLNFLVIAQSIPELYNELKPASISQCQ